MVGPAGLRGVGRRSVGVEDMWRYAWIDVFGKMGSHWFFTWGKRSFLDSGGQIGMFQVGWLLADPELGRDKGSLNRRVGQKRPN